MATDGEVLQAYTPEQKAAAAAALAKVDELADAVGGHVIGLEANFVRLGSAMHEVYRHQYWMVGGHGSFGKYLKSLEPRVKRGRTQLYHCLGVVQDLLPFITEEDLTEIGITKAIVLRKAFANGGGDAATEAALLLQAKTATKEELEELVGDKSEDDDGPGKWMSFGGARYTDEERAEFMRAVNITLRTDPPIDIGGTVKKWSEVPPQAKKEVLFRWLAGFVVEAENALREQSGLS